MEPDFRQIILVCLVGLGWRESRQGDQLGSLVRKRRGQVRWGWVLRDTRQG